MKHARILPNSGGLTQPQIRGSAQTAASDPVDPETNPDKGLTDGGTLTKPPVSDTITQAPKPVKSLQLRYSELQHRYNKLKAQFDRSKSPARSPEEIEHSLAAIRRFFATMNDSEGAVTAGNLYNAEYFAIELDSKFRVALLKWLTKRFGNAEPLISGPYNFWTQLLEREGHSV